ncbi:MAG TPA: hypothetical protein VFP98_04200 [Candidatus Polarisedimenticolia bacterium]|nr:hypothetical protein [Candidatus Polarisedimenticolia bacterium]
MSARFRVLALLVGALSIVAAPCAPALAASDACPMRGCADSEEGAIDAADCCCAASSAPAETSRTSTAAGSFAAAAQPAALVSGGADPARHPAFAVDRIEAPSDPVPLFLRHASLLN